MRVLFVTPPALKSHLYTQTPLASALRTAGHQVRVAIQPDLADALPATGLTGVVVGEDMIPTLIEVDQAEPERAPNVPGAPHPVQTDFAAAAPQEELRYLTEHFLSRLCAPTLVADLVAFARSWQPDLVIWDQLCYAGAIAAKASGAAHARLLFGTDALVQLRCAAREQGHADDPMREWLTEVLAGYGLPFTEDVITGDWTIDTMPPWTWQPVHSGVHYVPVRPHAFNGACTVPAWVDHPPARPRVALTLGLSHQDSGVAHASTSELLAAVADLDVEIVATLGGDADDATPLPSNVRSVDFVPMNALLPSCAAVIHQGGTGTFAAAYESAVPQLVVPSTYWDDKWFGPVAQAVGVEEQGAGLYVADSDALTAPRLRAALTQVLSDSSYAGNAARLARVLRGLPTPNELVPALERLTSGRGEHGR